MAALSVKSSQLLTDGPPTRTLLRFAFPILGINVLQYLAGAVNAFWVGRYLGEVALTAVANAQSIMFLLTGAAFGVAMAATVLVGQCMGAGKVAEAKRVVTSGAGVFVALSLAMSVAGGVLAEPLLIAMKTPGESLELAVAYTTVMFLALPIVYLYLFVVSLLIGTGDSTTPLRFMSLSAVIGTLLIPIFMFCAGPVPREGISASALAVLVSQATGLTTLISYLYGRQHPLCVYWYELPTVRVDWSIVRKLISKGIPMSAQVLVVSFSAVLMIVLVNRLGVETTAAYGASIQVWTYIQLPALSIAAAVTSMTAQSAGAQNWDRVRKIAQVGVVSCAVVTGSVVVLVYVAESYVYQLFLPADSPSLQIAIHLNRIVLWSFVLLVIATVLFGVMRASGVVVAPLLIHSVSLLCVRFPLAALLVDRWQADAIWWSFAISSAVDLVLAALYYRYGGWQLSGRAEIIDPKSSAAARRYS